MMEIRGNKWGVGSGKRRQGDKETRRQGDKEFSSPCPLVPLSPLPPFPIPHSLLALFVLFALYASAAAQDRPTSPPLTGRETPPASSPASSKAGGSGDRSSRPKLSPMSDTDPGAGPKSVSDIGDKYGRDEVRAMRQEALDRKRGVTGKSVDLRGRRIIT